MDTRDRRHPQTAAPKQLIIDGFHSKALREALLAMPEVDVVTTHHYPGGRDSYADLVRPNWAKTKRRKPHFAGEFGFGEFRYGSEFSLTNAINSSTCANAKPVTVSAQP